MTKKKQATKRKNLELNLDDASSENDWIVENDDGTMKVWMWTTWMGILHIEDKDLVQDQDAKDISDAPNRRIWMMEMLDMINYISRF